MHHASEPRWIMILVAIFALGMFLRLANSKRIGLLVLFLVTGLFLTYGLRVSRTQAPPRAVQVSAKEMWAAPSTLPPPERSGPPKRSPKSKPSPKAAPAPATPPAVDSPPEPAIAVVAEKVESTPSDAADVEAPLTLYHGMSPNGRPIESVPEWVKDLSGAAPGSNAVSFSSDRFATIEEAEKQLWGKARDFASRDLRNRLTEYTNWSPSADLLKKQGFILERVVERTEIEVGKFVEPMYRVHWKAALSKNVRDSLVAAWRPTVQETRLQETALGFLGATALLAFANVILRLAPCPSAKQPPQAAA